MTATLFTLWPIWLRTIGVIHRRGILMRSQCRRCGALMRVDPADLIARHGPAWSPIDAQERCRMVACEGAAFYLAARAYGGQWRILIDDSANRDLIEAGPSPVTAGDLRRAAARDDR